MKLGSVIGRVTLNSVVPELRGARWLVISPFTRERFAAGAAAPATVSAELNLVAYDCLGAAAGQVRDGSHVVAIGVTSSTLPAGAVRIAPTYNIRSEHNLGYIFTLTWRP